MNVKFAIALYLADCMRSECGITPSRWACISGMALSTIQEGAKDWLKAIDWRLGVNSPTSEKVSALEVDWEWWNLEDRVKQEYAEIQA